MNTNHAASGAWIACAIVMLSAAAPLQALEDVTNRTFSVKPGGKLVMDVDRGSIQIAPSDADEVQVEVSRKVDKANDEKAAEILRRHEITFAQEAADVRVTAELKNQSKFSFNGFSLQVKYTVRVPKKFDLDVRTHGGSVTVADLTGNVQAKTSAGSIKLGKIEGPVTALTSGGSIKVDAAATARLKTSAGQIDADAIQGDLSAETHGGSIRLNSVGGKLTATTSAGSIRIGKVAGDATLDTSGGSIQVEHVAGRLTAETSAGSIKITSITGPVQAKTSGGSIDAAITAQPKDEVRLHTSAGGIKIAAFPTLAANLNATCSAGHVTSELPVTVQGEQKRSALVGTINGGGPKLSLHTSGGGIRLTSLKRTTLEVENP
ncbi:MAG TPA: DUF4097 family beta strand repeat-containing protein [Bacillota bacterium]|nr:DUF4097 family beta strand repeat-containing protein [Bacillota bacterium]